VLLVGLFWKHCLDRLCFSFGNRLLLIKVPSDMLFGLLVRTLKGLNKQPEKEIACDRVMWQDDIVSVVRLVAVSLDILQD
jgi:hypothetical protein